MYWMFWACLPLQLVVAFGGLVFIKKSITEVLSLRNFKLLYHFWVFIKVYKIGKLELSLPPAFLSKIL